MGRRVARANRLVITPADDRAAEYDDRADRHFALPPPFGRELERGPHERFVQPALPVAAPGRRRISYFTTAFRQHCRQPPTKALHKRAGVQEARSLRVPAARRPLRTPFSMRPASSRLTLPAWKDGP